MITRAQVEKLGALHAVEPTMLSLYLAVPPSADRGGPGGQRPGGRAVGAGAGGGQAGHVRP